MIRTLTLSLLVVLAGLIAFPGNAAAIGDEEELWRAGGTGTGAGELDAPIGVASDPVTGHVLVVEAQSNRVSEFTPWGDFVKAFGWDVAPGPVNEQQEVRVRASSGQFRLSFEGDTTVDLPFSASGGEVEAALNGLASISGGGGSVGVDAVEGNPDGSTPYVYVVVFEGSLEGTDVAQIEAVNGTTPPGGGVPATELLMRTRADGTAGGTGLESCTAESGCQAGMLGAGVGQLNDVLGVAVDPDGNVYLREVGNRRVQKFDPAGRFLLMFGGEVNKTTGADRCTKADLEGGDVCGIGIAGSGDGEFGASISPGIVIGAGGKLFVGDVERIQRFDLEGEWELSVPVPGLTVHDFDIAPGSGDFYASVGPNPNTVQSEVRILDATTGAEKGILEAQELTNSKGEPVPGTKTTFGPVAIDPAGNIFALRANLLPGGGLVPLPFLQFDAAGEQVSEFGGALSSETLPTVLGDGLGTNAIGNLHVVGRFAGTIIAFGPGPVRFEGPPLQPPDITAQFATSVQRDSATVAAEINPRFFPSTRYYVQYGTGKCSAGGCQPEQPPPPGALLTTQTSNVPLRTAGVFLEDLAPGTTYHYRFVAESGGGGPVFGEEKTFVTYDPIAPKACPNDVFRGGAGARLPNCRAYEMASPIDKNNGDITTLVNILSYQTRLVQSASDGSRLTYSSYRAFADPKGAPFTNQLLATRSETGWSSEAIDPPQGPAATGNINAFGNNFKLFSDDLCTGWVVVIPEPQLDPPRDTQNSPNIYRRDNCGAGKESYEALNPVPSGDEIALEPQGVSDDGGAAIFRVSEKLTEDGSDGPWQAYYAARGELYFLCVLPDGTPSAGNCSGGTGDESGSGVILVSEMGRLANVENAISDNGSRVYWTDSASQETGAGKVYLRINPAAEQSESDCEEGKACTLEVSETKSTKDSRFLTASPDGSKALFGVTDGPAKGDLYLFDAESASSTQIAGETLGVAGTSDDLSRIYFVSEEALDGAAVAGEPNLYLHEGETKTFIATLSPIEVAIGVGEQIPSVTARRPIYHAAQASADGGVLAFISTASPTGYDNTDLANGKADSEVYLFEVGSEGPVCVSCNPGGARPQGRVVRLASNVANTLPIASTLTLPTTMLHAPRYLSPDGSRLFFNSFDPLLPRDTNGATDVYMWEKAPSKAACAALGAEQYVASAAGCLSLISSGESPEDSEFLDASQNGDDAFFVTNMSLLSQDPGLFDIYDARALGGLPPPPGPGPDCQGDTCKPPATAPDDPTPTSSSYVGPSKESTSKPKPRRRCGQGKRRVRRAGKTRCVKQQKRKQQSKRRAAR